MEPSDVAHDIATPVPRRAAGHRRRVLHRVLLAIVVLAALATTVLGVLYATLPSVDDAPARAHAIAARDGGAWARVARTSRIAQAVVATEDERYYEHGAIDLTSIARALGATVTSGSDPGGSTIAQQLAKVLYVRKPDSLIGRLHAIGLAFKLENKFSKGAVLDMYLNAVYYGNGYYGIDAASRGYFGRAPRALSWAQATLLAGLPQAPSAFDPVLHPGLALARRRQVLAQLVDNRILSASGARRVAAQPPRVLGPGRGGTSRAPRQPASARRRR